MQPELRILANGEDLARQAAAELVRLANESVREKGSFAVALSGGSTPRLLYSLLARDQNWRLQFPWGQTHFFWGDERCVPPDHAESNYRMANEAMLSRIPVPAANVHRVKGEHADPHNAAAEYEQTLREFFGLAPGQLPRFDLVLLGMGDDGHTASLFPGSEAVIERSRLVVANWVEKFRSYRITLTLPVLNNAARVLFLVGGREKAETLRYVLGAEQAPDTYPSQMVRPANGKVLWLVSQDAARLLPPTRFERSA